MALDITALEDGLVRLSGDDQTYTGINSALNSKVFRSADLGRLQNESGWIMDAEGRMEPWKISGVSEIDNQMIFYGPFTEGRLVTPENLSPEDLWILGHVFQMVYEKKLPLKGFFSRGWMITREKQILIFPPGLMDFIRKSQTEEVKQICWYPYNHPDKSGTEGLSFTLGVLSYLTLSGSLPYVKKKEEELSEEIRTQPAVPPELRIPGLKKPLADIMTRSLSPDKELPPLNEWVRALDLWDKEGACLPLPEEEKKEMLKKLEERILRRDRRLSRQVFWRKKKTLVFAALIALFILAGVISTPVRKALEPPLTMGMSPREVVEAYYSCFESMDQELMSDCIDGKAGKQDLNEVMNFFVTSRVREGYEGKSGHLSAREWTEQGRPMPAANTSVYGLTDLIIQEEGGDLFRANYEKWFPGSPDDDADMTKITAVYPVGMKVRDRLRLEKQKKGELAYYFPGALG